MNLFHIAKYRLKLEMARNPCGQNASLANVFSQQREMYG
ncbi:hypothetical protein FOPG_17383, partial [Fusarium oxysporum f. sp. conglutinans race 2 54008]